MYKGFVYDTAEEFNQKNVKKALKYLEFVYVQKREKFVGTVDVCLARARKKMMEVEASVAAVVVVVVVAMMYVRIDLKWKIVNQIETVCELNRIG